MGLRSKRNGHGRPADKPSREHKNKYAKPDQPHEPKDEADRLHTELQEDLAAGEVWEEYTGDGT